MKIGDPQHRILEGSVSHGAGVCDGHGFTGCRGSGVSKCDGTLVMDFVPHLKMVLETQMGEVDPALQSWENASIASKTHPIWQYIYIFINAWKCAHEWFKMFPEKKFHPN